MIGLDSVSSIIYNPLIYSTEVYMILKTEKSSITTNLPQGKKFNIEMNDKAFMILSKNLYKYPIHAVIREIMSNAWDSHLKSENYNPFYTHLPNELDPYYSVRDYGMGMSRETVEELYTTFFGSSKADSNLETGAFGLGSKTPFAYTDTFTITSWFDGIESQYVCYLNQHTPVLNYICEKASSEPSGVEIRLPVQSKDYYSFTQAFKTEVQAFVVIPKNNVFKLEEYSTPEVFLKGKSWTIYSKRLNLKENAKVYIHQGTNLFPLTKEYSQYPVSSGTLIIQVPNGSCSFAISREELSYDEGTLNYLKQIQVRVLKQIKSKLIKEYRKRITFKEKLHFLSQVEDSLQQFLPSSQKVLAECLPKEKDFYLIEKVIHRSYFKIKLKKTYEAQNSEHPIHFNFNLYGLTNQAVYHHLFETTRIIKDTRDQTHARLYEKRQAKYYLEDRGKGETIIQLFDSLEIPYIKLSELPPCLNYSKKYTAKKGVIKISRQDQEFEGSVYADYLSTSLNTQKRYVYFVVPNRTEKQLSLLHTQIKKVQFFFKGDILVLTQSQLNKLKKKIILIKGRAFLNQKEKSLRLRLQKYQEQAQKIETRSQYLPFAQSLESFGEITNPIWKEIKEQGEQKMPDWWQKVFSLFFTPRSLKTSFKNSEFYQQFPMLGISDRDKLILSYYSQEDKREIALPMIEYINNWRVK